MLIIPREGGYLVRLYIELDPVDHREMLEARSVTPEKLAEVANRILHPYTLDVKDVGWWSVYEIGQRLCDKFDDVPAAETGTRLPRVFIAGDACHTHSAKAGQGMNVSMADAWNLGWKLGTVLRGTARPELLDTYSAERQVIAQELIDFDREFAKMFSSAPKESDDGEGVDPAEFQRYFAAQGRFTAGVATRYAPSAITAGPEHQPLAEGFPVGMRFHSAPVVRLADAKPVQLGHAARADGAWRLYVFADRADPASRGVAGAGAVRVPGVGEVPDRAAHAGRRRPGLGHRRPRRLPAGPPGAGGRRSCRRCCCRGRARSGSSTTRRCSAPTRAAATSSTCGASTATPAAWSSSGPTSTSPPSSRWTRTRPWPTSSPGSWSSSGSATAAALASTTTAMPTHSCSPGTGRAARCRPARPAPGGRS